MGMSRLYYISEEMRRELLETFEAALSMALEQDDTTTADYYSMLINGLKKLKRAEHLNNLKHISEVLNKHEPKQIESITSIKPKRKMTLKQLSAWLKSVDDLTPEEKFELYYEEYDRLNQEKGSNSLDKMCRDLKLGRGKS